MSHPTYTNLDINQKDPSQPPHLTYKIFRETVSKQSCLIVHPKSAVIGGTEGYIYAFRDSGEIINKKIHKSKVNELSIDDSGSFIASCSDDCTVFVINPNCDVISSFTIEAPVQSVAIHPNYEKRKMLAFSHGEQVVMREEFRFTSKNSNIHWGMGPVRCLRWKNNYFAWVNAKCVVVYNVISKKIATMTYPEGSKPTLPCSLNWVKDGLILVGHDQYVLVAEVKTDGIITITCFIDKYFTDLLVCDVASRFEENEKWQLGVLCVSKSTYRSGLRRTTAPPPELIIIDVTGDYPYKTSVISHDVLLFRGYNSFTDFCFKSTYKGSKHCWYIGSTNSVAFTQETTALEQFDKLVKRGRIIEAVEMGESRPTDISPFKMKDIRYRYLCELIKRKEYEKAAKSCDLADFYQWETIVRMFMEDEKLQIILPYIYEKQPRFQYSFYIQIFYQMLKSPKEFLKFTVPKELRRYAIEAITEHLDTDPDDEEVWRIKAKLLEDVENYTKAVDIYFKLNDLKVFDLISKKKMYYFLKLHMIQLMTQGEQQLSRTVELLVEFHHYIQPSHVIAKLDLNNPEYKYYLYRYMDALYEDSNWNGSIYHIEMLFQLYAKYNHKKVLPFLQKNYTIISLDKALKTCEDSGAYDAKAFIYDCKGDPFEALKIMVYEGHDIEMAFDFVKRKGNKQLEELLTSLLKIESVTEVNTRQQIEEYKKQVDNLKVTNEGLITEKSQLLSQCAALKEQNTQLKKTEQETREAQGTLQSQFNALQSERDQLNNNYTELKNEYVKLQRLRQEKEQEIVTLQNLFEERIHELQTQLTSKAEEIAALSVSLSRMNGLSTIENSWKFSYKDVILSDEEKGRGGWGVVCIGQFRGQSVAVKRIHDIIMSSHTLDLLHREINIMAQLRHPNLLQFIGAVFDHPSGIPMILTEVMDTSLRKAYEEKVLTPNQQPLILSIMRDVAVGLNYLHCLPDPIIHRDVSSANVLLESKGPGKWKTKISDFGSAKLAQSAVTKAAGAEVYSAPEALQTIKISENKQTDKMDVYSYGILLCEIFTCRFPTRESFAEMRETIRKINLSSKSGSLLSRSSSLHTIVENCINDKPTKRPSMTQVIEQLDAITKSNV